MRTPLFMVVAGALFITLAAANSRTPMRKLGRYLGTGYNLFKGNPFNVSRDPGLVMPLKPNRTYNIVQVTFKDKDQCDTDYATCSFAKEHLNRDWLLPNDSVFNRPQIDLMKIEKTPCEVVSAFGINAGAMRMSRIHLQAKTPIEMRLETNTTLQTSLNLRSAELNLHPDFLRHLCKLTSANQAIKVLERFGTHVIMGVARRSFDMHRAYWRDKPLEERVNGSDRVFVTRLMPVHEVVRVLLLEHSAPRALVFCAKRTNYTGAPTRRAAELVSWLQQGLTNYTQVAWNTSWHRYGISRPLRVPRVDDGKQWCSEAQRQSTNQLAAVGALLYWLVFLVAQ